MEDKQIMFASPGRPLERDSRRDSKSEGPHAAVVDIGSNSVRLVVYDQHSRAPLPRFNEKSMCRLGEGLDQTGELSASSFKRTVEAMRRFRAVADAMAVGRIDVLATEAIRRATNGADLVATIARETGLSVRILSGQEEATFAALGVVAGLHRPSGFVGDMGGGSLEVTELVHARVSTDWISLPLGALPMQALLGRAGMDAKRHVDGLLKDSMPAGWGGEHVFYAVGGGWRAFAKVHMASSEAAVRVVHGYSIDATEARAFAKQIVRMPEQKIAALPGVPTRRVRTIAAAAFVLDRVLKRLAPERVVFSALGLREGWLYDNLPAEEQRLDPLLVGAEEFGGSVARVPAFSAALVRWTDDIFPNETPAERRLRLAACALSDIGWRDDSSIRAVESFRRLVQCPLTGIDHVERVFIAAVVHARYAGGDADDPALSPAITLLSPELRRRALILGRSMLLAYRLSGSVPEILGRARLQITTGSVRLEVAKAARVPDSDVVSNRLNLVANAAGVRRVEIVEVE